MNKVAIFFALSCSRVAFSRLTRADSKRCLDFSSDFFDFSWLVSTDPSENKTRKYSFVEDDVRRVAFISGSVFLNIIVLNNVKIKVLLVYAGMRRSQGVGVTLELTHGSELKG